MVPIGLCGSQQGTTWTETRQSNYLYKSSIELISCLVDLIRKRSMKKQTWQDSEGNSWSTTFKAGDAVRLRESSGVDILDPRSMEAIFGLDLSQSLARIEVIAELSRRQWESKGLTYTDFADALMSTPTSFIEATEALQASITYFFRQLGRPDLAAVCDRAWDLTVAQSKAMEKTARGEKVTELLERAAAKGMEAVDRELDRALSELGKPSGS